MMFKRKIYDTMLDWKRQSCGSTALLVEGARRVGKSSIVEEFARREYSSFILYTKDTMVKDGIRHLPLYMAMFL